MFNNAALLFILVCLVLFGCGQEKKDIVAECQVNCGGFPTEALTMKAYSDAVDVIWRYKFKMRIWQTGKIQFISPDYDYDTFKYIPTFDWSGTAIPVDGETFKYLMTNNNVIIISRTKDYIAVNFNGIYNLVVRCAMSTHTGGDKFELSNSKYFNDNILQVYPFKNADLEKLNSFVPS